MENTEPHAVSNNQKSSSVNPLLVVLLCIIFFVLGSLMTYLFVKTSLTIPGATEITPTIVQDSPTVAQDAPTKVQNTPTEEQTFYLEYDYNSPETRIYFTTILPQNTTVNYETSGTTGGKTVIYYEGESLLEFTIPHIALPNGIDEYHEIPDSAVGNLFRVRVENALSEVQRYSNRVYTDWGDDQCPQALVESLPCAELVVAWSEQTSVEAVFVGSEENVEIADEIVRSLELIN